MDIDEKEIINRLTSIDTTLIKQQIQLEGQALDLKKHIKRTDMLENYVRVLEIKVAKQDAFMKFAMWALPIVVSIAAVLTQIFIKVL